MLRHARLVAGIQVFAALSHLKTWRSGTRRDYARLPRAMPCKKNIGGDNSRENKLSPLLKPLLFFTHPARGGAPSSGVLMVEQTGGGRGDARSNPAAGKTPLARCPRARFATSHPGGYGNRALGTTAPVRGAR